ncbi:MAG: hypothetical protein JSV08_07565 [Acidobacteriota bacterium]|nr:MAG: hypothetical protein JSV08_07565 [Acidobacteriota bacterium]
MSTTLKVTLCFLALALFLVSTGCAKGQPEAETQETAAATEEVAEPVEAEAATEEAGETAESPEAEGETTETEETAVAETPEP